MLKLFEIKFYTISEEDFYKVVAENRDKFIEKYKNQNRTDEQTLRLYSQNFGQKNIYENYSIGYVEVLFDGVCLCYESKIMLSEKPSHSSKERAEGEVTGDEEADANKKTGLFGYSLVPYKTRLFSEKKRYMSNYHIGGKYSPVFGLSNMEIATQIKKDIGDIQTYDLFEKLHFDLSTLENILEYIDFVKLFEDYRARTK